MNYEVFKEKWSKNKIPVVLGICFVLVFFLGFGVGSYEKEARRQNKFQSNYTTKAPTKPVTNLEVGDKPVINMASSSQTTTGACIVKGNISATGKKTYHVKGGAFYDRTKAEQCFATEAEAVSNGFSKSSR